MVIFVLVSLEWWLPLFYPDTVETPKILIVIIHTRCCTKWHSENGRIWNGCYIFLFVFVEISSWSLKNCISLHFSDNGTIWTARHSVFAYDAFVKNSNSVTTAQRMFGWLVSRVGDVPWPPRSPDLPCCDFFLGGHLKERVYTQKPQTLVDLKQAITEEV